MGLKSVGNVEVDGEVDIYEDLGVTSMGHHLATKAHDGHLHPHAHSEFHDGISTGDTKILHAFNYETRRAYQPDNTSTFVGTNLEFSFTSPTHVMSNNIYYQVGSAQALADVRIQIWYGTDDTGLLLMDKIYSADTFVADTEIQLPYDGYVEYDRGITYFLRYSSTADFSLKSNAAQTMPWFYADVSDLREDDLLQTKEWVDGDSWNAGDYYIDARKMYICNTTGVQAGTFANNPLKWNKLSTLESDTIMIDTNGNVVADEEGNLMLLGE